MEIVKICPNCRAEVIDNFQLCWNCNYSFIENRIVEIAEQDQLKRQITCLRCKGVPMRFSGNYKFHEGSLLGAVGKRNRQFTCYLAIIRDPDVRQKIFLIRMIFF